MKLADIKEKIDNYFDKVSPEKIIKNFEKLGYTFEDMDSTSYQFSTSKEGVITGSFSDINSSNIIRLEKNTSFELILPKIINKKYMKIYFYPHFN